MGGAAGEERRHSGGLMRWCLAAIVNDVGFLQIKPDAGVGVLRLRFLGMWLYPFNDQAQQRDCSFSREQ